MKKPFPEVGKGYNYAYVSEFHNSDLAPHHYNM